MNLKQKMEYYETRRKTFDYFKYRDLVIVIEIIFLSVFGSITVLSILCTDSEMVCFSVGILFGFCLFGILSKTSIKNLKREKLINNEWHEIKRF